MYYVTLYDSNYNVIIKSPFENKNEAIKYFNFRSDHCNNSLFAPFKVIELSSGNDVLFEYEV